MDTILGKIATDRTNLIEAIANHRFMLTAVSEMPWHALKAVTVKRVAHELEILRQQLDNMR